MKTKNYNKFFYSYVFISSLLLKTYWLCFSVVNIKDVFIFTSLFKFLLNSTELLIQHVHDSLLFMIIVIASYDAEYLIIHE